MIKIIIISLSILAFGCGHENGKRTLYKYSVRNDSGRPITVKSFTSHEPALTPILTELAVGMKIKKEYLGGVPPGGYTYIDFFGKIGSPNRDSIIIIYGNLKKQVFKRIGCGGSERNPLSTCIYRKVKETFVFTEQDYENAEDCNGDCN
ncbi:MAG: hypothetical protein COA50_12815 [Flavobacteriaceae bacterium]|nr:MAG: hypothetical protein COA50_12815 [Flavobacteriaceae bacterium]